jgi:hypothetical protein
METFRAFAALIGITCTVLCYTFANSQSKDLIREIASNPKHQSTGSYNASAYKEVSYTVTSQSGFNGGAIGFGLISGMSFIAIAITFLRKEEN